MSVVPLHTLIFFIKIMLVMLMFYQIEHFQLSHNLKIYLHLTLYCPSPCTSYSTPAVLFIIITAMVLTHDCEENISWSQDDLFPCCPVVDAHVAFIRPVVRDPNFWEPGNYKSNTVSRYDKDKNKKSSTDMNKELFKNQIIIKRKL